MSEPTSQDNGPTLPAFPTNVPTTSIPVLSLSSLLSPFPATSTSNATASSILHACQTAGFFYLDLQSHPLGTRLLSSATSLHSLARHAFSQPLSSKLPYKLAPGSLFGYKPSGTVKSTDPHKRPDATEFWNIAKDHIHSITSTRSYPEIITSHLPLLQSFSGDAHELGLLILRVLAVQLNLPAEAFKDLNRFSQPSGDHIRLTHTAPFSLSLQDTSGDSKSVNGAIGVPSHTDFGSITILFNWLGGLQIQSPSASPDTPGEWLYVKPLPGHTIINLGDAMVTFTNGRLRSAKHRVVPAPGEQGGLDRYSVVYFVRPHDDTTMTALAEFCEGDEDVNDAAEEDGEEGDRQIQEKEKEQQKKQDKVNRSVAGKFQPVLKEDGKPLTAGEWMEQRARQLVN